MKAAVKYLLAIGALVTLVACGTAPIPPRGTGLLGRPKNTTCLAGAPQPPAMDLALTGCVNSEDPTQGASGLIPYDINFPFWTDGATKQRWIALPEGESIVVRDRGDWFFPVGSILLKTFSVAGKIIETRLFVYHDNGSWAGYSYEWNEAGTQAHLVEPEGKIRELSNGQSWLYPARSDCLYCHSAAAGRTLGLEDAQMNRLFTYPDTGITANQITTLASIGVLAEDPGDPEGLPGFFDWASGNFPDPSQLHETARAYLHANCSFCHRPGGPGVGQEDFRYQTPLAEMNACDRPPLLNDFDIPDARLMAPGDPNRSIIPFRMASLSEDARMPPLATFLADEMGLILIREWIHQLKTCEEP